MLNSSIGPLIFKKKTQGNAPQKKPMTPGPMNMYSLQIASQNKMPNPNMAMQQNPMGGMKPQDPNMAMQQMQSSTLKIENVSMQGGKKVGPHFMAPNPTKEMDPRQQMVQPPMGNMQIQSPMTGMNPLAQPTATNISLALKGNDKELGKTSEIPTNTLKIGNNKFSKDCKIVTKIVFTKKQFIWEIAEIGSPKKGEEEGKGNKRKFELKFSDIEKIDVNTDGNSIRIEAKEKPAGFKELNTAMKKTAPWIKESTGEHEFGEENGSGFCIIEATYPKESITKTTQGKLSHLDKIKRCELPLFIDGKSYIDSVPSTPLKTSSVNFGMAGDSYANLPNTPQLHQQHSNLSQMLPFTGQKKDNPFAEFAYGGQNPLPLVHKDSNFSVDLNNFNRDTGGEKILEEEPLGEGEEDDEDKEFPPLTKDKKADAKKFEGQLKNMKLDDKIDIIMETIKPKRFGINVLSKKIYKCPLYKCGFSKASVSHLKSHFQQKHRRIVEKGFSIDETGSFQWKPELLDFSLMVSKIYPKFVRNIIREAKKMP